MIMKRLYLDNAATTWPKPDSVYEAVMEFGRHNGASPYRSSSSESAAAAAMIESCRTSISQLIHSGAQEVVFTSGTTESMNLVIQGLLKPGDHVITTPFEHNSVLRPLNFMADTREVSISVLDGDLASGLSVSALNGLVRENTTMCIVNHVSNAFGNVAPLRLIGEVLKKKPDLLFVVDAAQSIGSCPIDVERDLIDVLCFSGHKGLYGPPGTGGIYIRSDCSGRIRPLKYGGTGFQATERVSLPEMPFKYEVGTQNTWGIAGLLAGVRHVIATGVHAINEHIQNLVNESVTGLSLIPGIQLYLPQKAAHHNIISFNFDRISPIDAATLLDSAFGIRLRPGLHCAPEAHKLAGTGQQGTLRISFSEFNDLDDVRYLLESIQKLEENYVED